MEFLDGFDPTPKLTKVVNAVKNIIHFLPDTPLASHGDHLPTAPLDLPIEPVTQLDFEQ